MKFLPNESTCREWTNIKSYSIVYIYNFNHRWSGGTMGSIATSQLQGLPVWSWTQVTVCVEYGVQFCMFSKCLSGFPLGSSVSYTSWSTYSKLPLGVTVYQYDALLWTVSHWRCIPTSNPVFLHWSYSNVKITEF